MIAKRGKGSSCGSEQRNKPFGVRSAGAPFFAQGQGWGTKTEAMMIRVGGPSLQRGGVDDDRMFQRVANGVWHAKSVPHPSGVPEEWGTQKNDNGNGSVA